jgi:hypothetical protein
MIPILIAVNQDSEATMNPLLTAPGKMLGTIKIQINFTRTATPQNSKAHLPVEKIIPFDF